MSSAFRVPGSAFSNHTTFQLYEDLATRNPELGTKNFKILNNYEIAPRNPKPETRNKTTRNEKLKILNNYEIASRNPKRKTRND